MSQKNGKMDVSTAGGIITGIDVNCGAGQGRKTAADKAILLCELKARFITAMVPGELFRGRYGIRIRHPIRSLCDDQSMSATGECSQHMTQLAAEAGFIASELVARCADNVQKCREETRAWRNETLVREEGNEIVLPTGRNRSPMPYGRMEPDGYTVAGIIVTHGVNHDDTSRKVYRTITAQNMVAANVGGNLLNEKVQAMRITADGANGYYSRVTIRSAKICSKSDTNNIKNLCGSTLAHFTTKTRIHFSPSIAGGTGLPLDGPRARGAFLDQWMRNFNLSVNTPWRNAQASMTAEHAFLRGCDLSGPHVMEFVPSTIETKLQTHCMVEYLWETLRRIGAKICFTGAKCNDALGQDGRTLHERILDKNETASYGLKIWDGSEIKDTQITNNQRLRSLGLRDLHTLIADVKNDRPHKHPYTIWYTPKEIQEVIGRANGVRFTQKDVRQYKRLLQELNSSSQVRSALHQYAKNNKGPTYETRRARYITLSEGGRMVDIRAARLLKPPLTEKDETTQDQTEEHIRTQFLVRYARDMWCEGDAEGRWLDQDDIQKEIEKYIEDKEHDTKLTQVPVGAHSTVPPPRSSNQCTPSSAATSSTSSTDTSTDDPITNAITDTAINATLNHAYNTIMPWLSGDDTLSTVYSILCEIVERKGSDTVAWYDAERTARETFLLKDQLETAVSKLEATGWIRLNMINNNLPWSITVTHISIAIYLRLQNIYEQTLIPCFTLSQAARIATPPNMTPHDFRKALIHLQTVGYVTLCEHPQQLLIRLTAIDNEDEWEISEKKRRLIHDEQQTNMSGQITVQATSETSVIQDTSRDINLTKAREFIQTSLEAFIVELENSLIPKLRTSWEWDAVDKKALAFFTYQANIWQGEHANEKLRDIFGFESFQHSNLVKIQVLWINHREQWASTAWTTQESDDFEDIDSRLASIGRRRI